MKTYIAHYSPLKERKEFQISQLKKFNMEAEFIEIYNKEDLNVEDLSKFDLTKISLPKISLSLKHHHIYKEIYNNHDYALILEDDSVFVEDFHNLLKRCVSELPKNWDTIFIGDCCNLHLPSNKDQLIYLKSNEYVDTCAGSSRGTGAYLLSKQGAQKLLLELQENKEKIFLPVDWWLCDVFRKYNMKSYWSEPVLVLQGSETGVFKSSLS